MSSRRQFRLQRFGRCTIRHRAHAHALQILATGTYLSDRHLEARGQRGGRSSAAADRLDDRWPIERRRAIVGGASDLYRWRGTPRGLREFVRLYTGYVPDILEPTSAQVAADRSLAFSFVLRLQVPAGAVVSQELLETIVEVEKPAFARYIVNIEVMGA